MRAACVRSSVGCSPPKRKAAHQRAAPRPETRRSCCYAIHSPILQCCRRLRRHSRAARDFCRSLRGRDPGHAARLLLDERGDEYLGALTPSKRSSTFSHRNFSRTNAVLRGPVSCASVGLRTMRTPASAVSMIAGQKEMDPGFVLSPTSTGVVIHRDSRCESLQDFGLQSGHETHRSDEDVAGAEELEEILNVSVDDDMRGREREHPRRGIRAGEV